MTHGYERLVSLLHGSARQTLSVLAALVLFLLVPSATAQTFTVNDTSDLEDLDPGDGLCDASGDPGEQCTLRAAIQENNALGGGATINVPAGTYVLTRDGRDENEAEEGDLDILFDVTIVGDGEDVTIIDGDGNDRVFHVLPAPAGKVAEGPTVELKKLTVTGGFTLVDNNDVATHKAALEAGYLDGGGILNEGGDLTLTQVTVTENGTGSFINGTTNVGNGGGVANIPPIEPVPGKQAGAAAAGTLTLDRVTIVENWAGSLLNDLGAFSVLPEYYADAGGSGGGLFNVGGLVTIVKSTISANVANTNGGGIANVPNVTLDEVSVEAVEVGTINADDLTLDDNQAGGTGFIFQAAQKTDILVSLGGNGGGLFNAGGLVTIVDGKIRGNRTHGGFGGGVASVSSLGTVLLNGDPSKAAGVAAEFGQLDFADVLIASNATGHDDVVDKSASPPIIPPFGGPGGGVYNECSTVAFTGVTIEENATGDGFVAGGFGGGLANSGGVVTLTNAKVRKNYTGAGTDFGSVGGAGGGLFNGSGYCPTEEVVPTNGDPVVYGDMTLDGTLVEGNYTGNGASAGGPGGGIFNGEGFFLAATTEGPAGKTADVETNTLVLNDSEVTGNWTGSGVSDLMIGQMDLTSGVGGFGGGIANDRGVATLNGTRVTENHTGYGNVGGFGGGVFSGGINFDARIRTQEGLYAILTVQGGSVVSFNETGDGYMGGAGGGIFNGDVYFGGLPVAAPAKAAAEGEAHTVLLSGASIRGNSTGDGVAPDITPGDGGLIVPGGPGGPGGGLASVFGYVEATNTTIADNRTGDGLTGGDGGGVYNVGYNDFVEPSEVTAQEEGFGLSLANSTVEDNTTGNGVISYLPDTESLGKGQGLTENGFGGGHGGGLFNAGGAVLLTGTAVSGNTTGFGLLNGGFGGGVYNGSLMSAIALGEVGPFPAKGAGLPYAGLLVLDDAGVNANETGAGVLQSGFGGGIYNGDAAYLLFDFFLYYFREEGSAAKFGDRFKDRTPATIEPFVNVVVAVEGSTIDDNATGGVFNTDDIVPLDKIPGYVGGFGGGLANDGGHAILDVASVSGNTTGDGMILGGFGGGIYNGNLLFDTCLGCFNKAAGPGFEAYGTLEAYQTTVARNRTGTGVVGGMGGGIRNDVFPFLGLLLTDFDQSALTSPYAFILENFPLGEIDATQSDFGPSLYLYATTVSGNRTGDGVDNEVFLPVGKHAADPGLAGGWGGGLHNAFGLADIRNSTFSGNTTGSAVLEGFGGGIATGSLLSALLSAPTYLYLNNVTVTDNATGTSEETELPGGGGVFALTVEDVILTSDLVGDTAPSKSGEIEFNVAYAGNTIIADNAVGADQLGPDCYGFFVSEGYNLIGDGSDCFGFGDDDRLAAKSAGPALASDQVGTAEAPIDPLLGSLADNGGPTLTHALLPFSPAYDRGSPTVSVTAAKSHSVGYCESDDQRGVERPLDGDVDGVAICDVGAFEGGAFKTDLALTKEADTLTPDYTGTVTFTIVLTNNGPLESASAAVTDVLPAGFTFASASATNGSYDAATGVWSVGLLSVGQSATLTLTATVDTPEVSVNTAAVTASEHPDADPGNNSDSVEIDPIAIDLSLTKDRISYSEDGPAGTFTAQFRITLTNNGPDPATDISVTEFLTDDTMVFTDATPDVGTFDLVAGVWDVPALDVGETVALLVTLTAPIPEDGNLWNTTEVTSAGQVDIDSVPNNANPKEDDLAGDLAARPGEPNRGRPIASDLTLTKTVDNAAPTVGDEITYTLTVTNAGPTATNQVTVSDLLPAGLDFVSATASKGAYDPETGLWVIGHLANKQTVTLTITVVVAAAGEIVNVAEITKSTAPDPDSIAGDHNPNEDDMDSVTISASSARARFAEGDGTPLHVELGTNYPNPFNPETTIPYAVPEASHVTIQVYDLLGRLVETLVDESVEAGRHDVTFQADRLPTGVYLVRMEAAGKVYTLRITLMK